MDHFDPARFLVLVPAAISLAGVIITLVIANYIVRRNQAAELSVSRQLFMLLLTATCVLVVIFMLPLSETSRGQLLSLLGIVFTAVIALSSTSFVANIMAGLMLRAVNSFKPGDFIRCGETFGRVTERGLFHTEIQTEDRDLTTLPNMYLVNNPVTVVHDSGTIISATLSLGYEVAHARIEELLKEAATEAKLEDPFVLVGELGDFSVSYRVGGFSQDVNRLLTIKSSLRKSILNVLHENGIEIVSPNFMNQRVLKEGERMIPLHYREALQPEETTPEEVIFAKADTAAEKEALKEELTALSKSLKEAEETKNGMHVESIKRQIDAVTERLKIEDPE
jgi:small-conductance mechanosensitive channel